jgi:hypothetical protein
MTLEIEIFRWKKVTLNNKITVLGLVVLVFWKIEVTFLILIKKFTNGIILKDVQFVMICPGHRERY